MLQAILVGLGGFFGALSRYGLGLYIRHLHPETSFPYATLSINVLGCFFMGLCFRLIEMQGEGANDVRLFFVVGLLGAFTTYSTFSQETLKLFQNQGAYVSALNVGAHLVLGFSALFLGRWVFMFFQTCVSK